MNIQRHYIKHDGKNVNVASDLELRETVLGPIVRVKVDGCWTSILVSDWMLEKVRLHVGSQG